MRFLVILFALLPIAVLAQAPAPAAGAAYLTNVAAVARAVKTDSGLLYTETARGTGTAPMASDRVSRADANRET